MDLSVRKAREAYSYRAGVYDQITVEVATEFALTVFVDGQEFATLVCTPADLEELVVGFLASEGIIKSYGDIQTLLVSGEDGSAYVSLLAPVTLDPAHFAKRYIASCCGKGRQSFYFYNDAQTAPVTAAGPGLQPESILQLTAALQRESLLFQITGGTHNAALCDHTGALIAIRTDIGRHNALDKLFGYLLMERRSATALVLAFSGRVSSEVLLKVAKMGVGTVLSMSAPTELALQMAEELGVTVVGFVREGGFTVYTHPERVRLPMPLS